MTNRKQLFIPVLLIIMTLVLVAPTAAQEAVLATLAPAGPTENYTVGDPILLELTVHHPAGTHLIVPDIPESWGEFTVVSVGSAETVTKNDGEKTTTLTIDTRLFTPGEFQTPPLTIELADTAGQLNQIELPAVPITVQSVLVPGDTELRDIKPPVDLPAKNIILLFLGGVLLGTAGAGGAYWFWQHNRPVPIPVDTRPAYVIALADLDELAQQNLPARRQFKPYYTELSAILRRFLGREYQIVIHEMTTTEISDALQQRPLTPALRGQFMRLLHECDLVKFADAPSGPVQAAAIIEEMRSAIQATQPLVSATEIAITGRDTVSPPAIQVTPAPMEVN